MRGFSLVNSVVKTEPASEPLTLAQVKEYLKLESDFTDEDFVLNNLISDARIFAEKRCCRSIIKQVRTQYMDGFPLCDSIQIMYGPLFDNVVAVRYYDDNDTLQVMSPSDYWVDSTSDIGRVVVKNSWPSVKSRPNAVEIEYNAGYGESPSDVPASLRTAMMYYIAHFYENRVPETVGVVIGKFSITIDNLLSRYTTFQNGFLNVTGYSHR